MAVEFVSVIIKAGLAISKFVPATARTVWNYWKRHKFELSAACTNIEFISTDKTIEAPTFPCVRIRNTSSEDATIDLNIVNINGEPLSFIIQQNNYYF
jgi:hypothetical protein